MTEFYTVDSRSEYKIGLGSAVAERTGKAAQEDENRPRIILDLRVKLRYPMDGVLCHVRDSK